MKSRYLFSPLAALLFTTPVSAVEVTRGSWIEFMSTALPTHLCQSEQYFRQCFTVSAMKCEEVVASSTRVCINKSKDKIPEILFQPKDGTHWGTIIGTCAGQSYEAALVQSKVNSSKCSNANNWK